MPSLADRVRQRDPDRYFCALFAPADRREALFTLYAFNDELARAGEVASEPALALIRLQWWREVVEGADRRHDVAAPLRALVDTKILSVDLLLEVIAARESDVESPPETLAAFVARMRLGPGSLAAAAGAALGALPAELERLRDLGAAYGVAGTLRNVPALARRQQCALPRDVLAQAGLVPEAAFSDPERVRHAVWPILAAAGQQLLGRRASVRRNLVAAALLAALARRDLARETPAPARGAGDRFSVLWAALRAQV